MNEKFYAEMQERYLQATALIEGDSVKVVAIPTDGVMGWQGNMYTSLSEDILDDSENEFVVIEINPRTGVQIENVFDDEVYQVPFFCIEKLDQPSTYKFELDNGGTVTINEDGIDLDGQYTLTEDDIDTIKEKIDLINGH